MDPVDSRESSAPSHTRWRNYLDPRMLMVFFQFFSDALCAYYLRAVAQW